MDRKVFWNLMGVIAVSLCWSVGGPLSWYATGTLSASQSAWGRCSFACLGLLPFLFKGGWRTFARLPRRGQILLAASGVILGIHFFFFISGVAYASLATAVTLVAVEPALLLVVGAVGFKDRVRAGSVLGLAVCLLGVGVVAVLPHLGEQPPSGQVHKAYGDLCAVLAILGYGVYYALNRAFKPYQGVQAEGRSVLVQGFVLASVIYVFAALSSGAIALGMHLTGSEQLTMPSGPAWLALIGMGLIPTILGHTLSQIVSRTAPPIWVSLMSPGETLVALVVGAAFLGQHLSPYELIGGGLILLGVAWVVRTEGQRA